MCSDFWNFCKKFFKATKKIRQTCWFGVTSTVRSFGKNLEGYLYPGWLSQRTLSAIRSFSWQQTFGPEFLRLKQAADWGFGTLGFGTHSSAPMQENPGNKLQDSSLTTKLSGQQIWDEMGQFIFRSWADLSSTVLSEHWSGLTHLRPFWDSHFIVWVWSRMSCLLQQIFFSITDSGNPFLISVWGQKDSSAIKG